MIKIMMIMMMMMNNNNNDYITISIISFEAKISHKL